MYSYCIRRIIHNILLGLGGLPRLLSFVVLKKLSSFLFVSLCVRQSPYEACTHISSLMTVSIVLDYGSERLTLIASSETSPLLPGVSAPDFPSAPEASTSQPIPFIINSQRERTYQVAARYQSAAWVHQHQFRPCRP